MAIDRATLTQRLSEAETALHSLMIGNNTTTVKLAMGDGAREVTYTPANRNDLKAYIQTLRGQLGLGGRRAIGVRF